MIWTVKQLSKELNVSKATVNRFMNRFKKELSPFVKKGKRNRIELDIKGKERLFDLIKSNTRLTHESVRIDSEPIRESVVNAVDESIQQPPHEPIHINSESIHIESFLIEELKRKDETINKLIDRQASSEEKLQTIIMKLTQDLEKIRNENQLLLESTKKNKEPEKEKNIRKDRVVSIEEYINKKVEEEKEKSNYEKEKKRLKNKYSNPLQGKSKLYQFYIKLFRPEKLRRNA